MSAGMPFLSSCAIRLHARTDDAELDRVEHAPAVRQVLEAMPALARMQNPVTRVRRELLRGHFVKRDALAALRVAHRLRIPGREEPVLLGEELLANARDRKAAGDGLVDRLLREHLAGRAVHDRRRDVVRRDQRIERRSARLRAIRLVEAPVIDGAAAVADVNERGLRQRGQQLVRRMRREHRRAVLRVRRRVAAHGVAVAIHRVEARVAVPRFVEMDPVDALAEARLRVGRVVAHAVVGAVGQHRVDGALVPARLGQRIGGDALRDRLGLELLRWNRAR